MLKVALCKFFILCKGGQILNTLMSEHDLYGYALMTTKVAERLLRKNK
jgi:hypothetical protein